MRDIKYEKIQFKENVFYLFFFDYGITCYTIKKDDDMIFNVSRLSGIEKDVENLLLKNKKSVTYNFIGSNDNFVDRKTFLNIVSWVSHKNYKLYKQYSFYITLFFQVQNLKKLNEVLKNFCLKTS